MFRYAPGRHSYEGEDYAKHTAENWSDVAKPLRDARFYTNMAVQKARTFANSR
jgi:hypothetical protein